MENINISIKEMEAATILEKLIRREITQKEGAQILKLCERQIRRKLTLFKKAGAESLIHKNKGKKSKNKWEEKNKIFLFELLKNEWQDFGPTFATEKLEELYSIKVSEETVRKLMIEGGFWTVRGRKSKHRIRRMRKVAFGIMIQLDGSPHDWFEGRAPKCTLLVFIDDATSKIVWLEFVKSESVEGVMKATLNYFKQYGLPSSFYVDFGSVFSVNVNNPERDKITQFERAMKELNIDMIHATSPQAKGRVERSNKTHQDRLVKEMRLKNICSMEDGNAFLHSYYLKKHNLKFEKEPSDSTNVHRSIEKINLNNIMCIKEERVLQNDFTLQFDKRIFQLEASQKTIIRPKDLITVNVHLDKTVRLSIRKTDLFYKEINQKPVKPIMPKVYKHAPVRPSENSRKSLSRLFIRKEDYARTQISRVG